MHHLERAILRSLIYNPSLRYAKIKPPHIEGNQFMYHLRRLINEQLVVKIPDGSYQLTPKGKLLADKMQLETLEIDQQPRSVILMAVRDSKQGWLLHRRKIQPVINMVGFLHANLKLGESMLITAARTLKERAGLTAEFKFRGSGTITIYQGEAPESYIVFSLVEAWNPTGELLATTEIGDNFWQTKLDFSQPEILPSMQKLTRLLAVSDQLFFTELTYHLPE